METEMKSGGTTTTTEEVKVANPRSIRSSDFLLRLMAVTTTLVAAIVMGLAKETELVPVTLIAGSPPIYLSAPARMRYSSALVYFVVANSIACAHSMVSLLAVMGMRRGSKGLTLVIAVLDVVMVGLLFSGNGAAAAIGVLGYNGNSHVMWNKVCNVFDKFCRNIAVSLGVSLIGSLVFILLVVLSIMSLHRKAR